MATSPTGGVERTFVGLASPVVGRAGAGGHPCQGIWHTPAGDPRPTTALIATHYNVDFSEHYLADFMARRGYGFLGWNTRFRGAEAYFTLDHALAEIGVGVQFLRDQGVERIVLLGNSGGASLMGAYHSQSVEPNVRPARGRTVLPQALELPQCDAFVSLAAHPGRPDVITDWMDASVIDEFEPTSRDPSLDPFDPGPPYDAEFVARYRAAQRDRNARITAWCHAELDRLEAAGIGDRVFTMTRTWADLRMMDPALDPSERPPQWCYSGDPRKANAGVFGLGVLATCRSWLNMWSLTDSDCRAGPHLARVHVPALVVNATRDAGVYPSQAAEIYDALASSDKELVQLPGDHYFTEPQGARDEVADAIAAWLVAH